MGPISHLKVLSLVLLACDCCAWNRPAPPRLLRQATHFVVRTISTRSRHLEKVTFSEGTTDADVDAYFMERALDEARRSASLYDEVPIGAVLVRRRDNNTAYEIISAAGNRVEGDHDASAHAELLALRKAARKLQNWRLYNTTLYSTLEPCVMCLAAIQAFRVSRVVYGALDHRLGAVESHIELLKVPHPYHVLLDVTSGVRAEACGQTVRQFFRDRRRRGRKKP